MPFSSQFNLSLELTRLLPLASVADSATQTLIRFARDLRNSGSDVVVEEDLVEIFGRCRISSELGSSFRTVIKESVSNKPLWEGIMLQAGPGPTLSRAFREPTYFSMVVQLSLLTWCYEPDQLATAMTEVMANRLEGAPMNSNPGIPSRDGIFGVLKACERQTSAFNWNMMLYAVANSLDYPVDHVRGHLSTTILQGALDMFAMIQTLPEDRVVYIRMPMQYSEDDSGVCSLVVWTHNVLGLSVLVKQNRRSEWGSNKDVRFERAGSDQVIIEEVDPDVEPAISLLDPLNEDLLTIRPNPEAANQLIGSIQRVHARGWGTALISKCMTNLGYDDSKQKMALRELQLDCCAFALIISTHLCRDDAGRLNVEPKSYQSESFSDHTSGIYCYTDPRKIIVVANLLFDNPHINERDVKPYLIAYSSKALNSSDLSIPITLEAASESHKFSHTQTAAHWNILSHCFRGLGVYLIAFGHILNLQDCESMTFCGAASEKLNQHHLIEQLEEWDGVNNLYIRDDAWMQAIAVPLIGQAQNIWSMQWDRFCLVSDRGWSIWIPTFGDTDPAYVSAGDVIIGRGSPCRNGVWKCGVWDMQQGVRTGRQFTIAPELAEKSGQRASLRCAEKVSFEKALCGEGNDFFLISARFKRHCRLPEIDKILRFGYRELHTSLWWTQLTSSCNHKAQKNSEIDLPVGCVTLGGFGYRTPEVGPSIFICLTSGDSGARWLALATFPWFRARGNLRPRRILLRREDCCFRCALNQAALNPTPSVLVL